MFCFVFFSCTFFWRGCEWVLTDWLVCLLISSVIRTEPWHLCLLGKQGNTELNSETLRVMFLVYVVWVCSQALWLTALFLPATVCFLPLPEICVMCPTVSKGLNFDDAIKRDIVLFIVVPMNWPTAESRGLSTSHLLFLGEKKIAA